MLRRKRGSDLQRHDGADLAGVQTLKHNKLVHAVHELRAEVLLHLLWTARCFSFVDLHCRHWNTMKLSKQFTNSRGKCYCTWRTGQLLKANLSHHAVVRS